MEIIAELEEMKSKIEIAQLAERDYLITTYNYNSGVFEFQVKHCKNLWEPEIKRWNEERSATTPTLVTCCFEEDGKPRAVPLQQKDVMLFLAADKFRMQNKPVDEKLLRTMALVGVFKEIELS